MDESDFEGTLILERMSELGFLDDFFEAIDSDQLETVKRLMKQAGIDPESIQVVLRKIRNGEGN